jgi:acetyltransferase-like isoleucine patch superfamily enzyme
VGDRLFFVVQGILKYVPFAWAVYARRWAYPVFFRHFGKRVVIDDNVLFKYPSQISVGDGVHVSSGCVIAGLGGLSIGDNVMIGHGSKIVTSSHVFESTDKPMLHQGLITESISIGSDVWLGFDVKVLPGSVVGTGVVLAAGTVVLKGGIPDRAVVTGVPGKIVRIRE